MTSPADKTSAECPKDPFMEGDLSHRRRVSLRMTVIARLQRNNFDRKVTDLNVTRSQWAMIAVVARYPGSTQRTVAEYLEMSEASAGRLIDRLCADGLLERRDRRDDRRARAVYLTDAAGPLLEKLGKIANESEERMFQGFSDEEIERLLDYMNRIYENVSRG
ncbi:transcriptional regulator [Novosphingobium endophyticum]|uniref:Transcriptional regulator n=1 Tax=Novosphingobium endophyticum TaxID=1955250 RepID=A0A916TRW4_9SPHN|nr:MarR family winged helix-turn-helix transcriptional regulator [Novosphingobium endophyticum]GGB99047.1 transcriptional regulator [Novosphingobium endophyticum]